MYLSKIFDKEEWSWFELRYHMKQVGLVADFVVHQKLSQMDFEQGLVVINCDTGASKMLDVLDVNQNVELFIEHLEAGTGFKEMVPYYCKIDTPVEAQFELPPNDGTEAVDKVVEDTAQVVADAEADEPVGEQINAGAKNSADEVFC